jgi:hypothetical protein
MGNSCSQVTMSLPGWVKVAPLQQRRGGNMAGNTGVRRFLSSRRGSIAVEAAMAVPFFLMLVLGIVDIGRAALVQYGLRQAARNGAAFASVRTADDAAIKSAAAAAAGVPAHLVKVARWTECGSTRIEGLHGCADQHRAARFLEVRVSGGYQPTFSGPLMSAGPSDDIILSARVVRPLA